MFIIKPKAWKCTDGTRNGMTRMSSARCMWEDTHYNSAEFSLHSVRVQDLMSMPMKRTWHRAVPYEFADVSEERTVSIFWTEDMLSSKLLTSTACLQPCRWRQYDIPKHRWTCRTTQRFIPEDSILLSRFCRTWGSHRVAYEEFHLQGYNVV
jgi:hypothetical protein